MASTQNVFTIGRRRDREDQLTEMLVWLVGAVPEVGEELVRMGFSEDVGPMEGVRVTTQHGVVSGRLDAFLAGPAFELIVESKLNSAYGDNQIRKYLDWLIGRPYGPRRGLMTLTAKRADWNHEDLDHAQKNSISAAPRRWEDLHAALAPFLQQSEDDSLAARLVREFLEMLAEEKLIPMPALASSELGDSWAKSAAVERRFLEYFRACVPIIGQKLDIAPHPNRWSSKVGLAYQDFETSDGESIMVAFQSSDEGLDLRPKIYRKVPIIWLGVLAKTREDWEAVCDALEAAPPSGWRLNPKRYYRRPRIWRYLDELVLPAETFEEQAAAIAAACKDGLSWLATAPSLMETPTH